MTVDVEDRYGAELLAFVDGDHEIRELEAGEDLVRQHERGSEVFVVLDGRLDALIESGDSLATVGEFSSGQLFGELTAISGGPRTATVRAASNQCSVAVVGRGGFMRWLDSSPDHYDAVAARARRRVDQNRAAAMLAFVLGNDSKLILDLVLPMVEWRTLEPGEILCNEGDPSGSAYLILSGRVSVTSEQRIGTRGHVELGRNQIVGELGVLDRLPRTATVTALRRTSLAELPSEAIDRIITTNPEVAIHLFRQALGRALHPELRSDEAKAVALIFTAPDVATEFVQIAKNELERFGSVVVMDSATIDAHLGQAGVAASEPGSVGASRVDELLHDVETSCDYLLLHGATSVDHWTVRTAETADRTLIVASAHPSPDEVRLLEALEARLDENRLPWWRLILHPSDTSNPANHRASVRRGSRVLHARRGNEADTRRSIRLLSANGVGLALGGGGARGFGHIGAYRAMAEAGIAPDVIAGTSIGSVFGLAMALDWTTEQMTDFTRDAFSDLLDWTVPIVSFLKGERITQSILDGFGDYRIESLWRPFSSVVTNLTHASVDIRNTGPADRAVRMSVSIPGVLPPMSENGEIFVDGGVLNNLPADIVAADSSVRTVIAIDVSPPSGPRVKGPIEPSLSGMSVLASRARGRVVHHPTAAAVVMQTMVAGSGKDRQILMEDGTIDHYMHLDIRGSSLLAFDTLEPVIEQGYESAKQQLDKWFPEGYSPAAAIEEQT